MKKILISSLVLLAIFTVSCSKKSDNGGTVVKYTIAGNSNMDVTYTDASMTSKTVTGVNSTWTYTFSSSATGQLVHLAVKSTNGTLVSGKIYFNNQQENQNDAMDSINISAQLP